MKVPRFTLPNVPTVFRISIWRWYPSATVPRRSTQALGNLAQLQPSPQHKLLRLLSPVLSLSLSLLSTFTSPAVEPLFLAPAVVCVSLHSVCPSLRGCRNSTRLSRGLQLLDPKFEAGTHIVKIVDMISRTLCILLSLHAMRERFLDSLD